MARVFDKAKRDDLTRTAAAPTALADCAASATSM